jgi:hypothetical protein
MQSASELSFDFIELCSQALPNAVPKHDELPISGLAADMWETKEIKSFAPTPSTLLCKNLGAKTN